MTVADVLVDPAQQAFEEASRDPLEILTDAERSQAQRLIEEGNAAETTAQAAVVLGGAFLLYRAFMATRLGRTPSTRMTRSVLDATTEYYWRQLVPAWVWITAGVLDTAARSSYEVRTGNLPPHVLVALSEDYALRLGRYMHETTKIALLEGFTAHLNKQVPRQMATRKAIEALGLNQRQMRALTAMKPTAKIFSVSETNPDVRSQAYIDQALVNRARSIGENETHTISQEAKQLTWMYQLSKGILPADTKRMWVTAKDERVCKVCGPMHRKVVPLDEPFKTPNGRMWSPSMHPNCRCEIKLKIPVKADVFLKKDRDGDGDGKIFDGTRLERLAPVKTKEAPVATPALPKLDRPALPRVERVSLPKLDLPKVETQAPAEKPQVTAQVDKPQVSAPQLTKPMLDRAEALRVLVERPQITAQVQQIREHQLTQAPAKPQTKPKTDTGTKTVFSYRHPINPVYMWSEVADYHSRGSDEFEFYGDQFGDYNEMMNGIAEHLDAEIEVFTNSVMETGKNHITVRNPNGETFEADLTAAEVEAYLQAELYGSDDDAARQIARNMGFHREDYTMTMFVVSDVDTREFEGDVKAYQDNDNWEIGGRYTVDHYGTDANLGMPVKFFYLKVDAGEDEELD